jgi:Ni/Fe-hydrogenase subunit HybB-like protein
MIAHARPARTRLTLRTPGVAVLAIVTGIGLVFATKRFIFGLESTTHLDQQYPWGLWIAFDVATGVALAAGGFTTAALAHVFHRTHYEAIVRPALLTAVLGYTFVALGLMVDLGRYYNIWHPLLPSMWQGNSVLFEVAICVVFYLTVLYLEFLPVVCERFVGDRNWPRLARLCALLKRGLSKVMWALIIAGVVLSCLHQSSLGNLMVIAPSKMHPLWYTPLLPLLFLLSAVMVGFPMVVCESVYSAWSFRRPPEMDLLAKLARIMPVLIVVYLAFKVGDLLIRGGYRSIRFDAGVTYWFLAEVVLGVLVPMVMLLFDRVRRSPRRLVVASLLVVAGVALNRMNVFVVAYHPPYATTTYFPSIGEFAVTAGLVACLILVYRVLVTFLPVLPGVDTAVDEAALSRRRAVAPRREAAASRRPAIATTEDSRSSRRQAAAQAEACGSGGGS